MKIFNRYDITFVLALLIASPTVLARAKVVEKANPYPKMIVYRQGPDDKICWAIVARSMISNFTGNTPRICEVVSKTNQDNCCDANQRVRPHCNQIGWAEKALNAYRVKHQKLSVNFDRIYQTLSQKGLVAMIMDTKKSPYDVREGHITIIHSADKLMDGSYTFYVADSSKGAYKIHSKDFKRMANGHYALSSLLLNYTWESMILATP